MTSWNKIAGIVALCVVTCAAAAELPETAKRMQATARANLGALRDQVLADQIAALTQYTNDLARAADKCKKAGDLDGLLAIGEEQKFVAKGGAFPEKDDAGLNGVVAALRQAYRATIAKAKDRMAQQQRVLLTRYLEELEALKKRLTVDGDIDGAVAVREYMTVVRQELDKVPQSAPPSARDDKVDCPSCSGSGKRLQPCPKCSGSGSCSLCGGVGSLPPGLKGLSDRRPCLICRRSGKCANCDGDGTVPGAACEDCQGSGEVTKAKADSLTRPQSKPVPLSERKWGRRGVQAGDDRPGELGARMKDAFDRGDMTAVDMDKVLAGVNTYRGKVCRSSVILRNVSGGQMSAKPDADSSATVTFIAYSIAEEGPLAALSNAAKSGDKVAVIYGVLDSDTFLLFRAVPAKRP